MANQINLSPEILRAQAQVNQQQREVREVAQGMESIFLKHLVDQMRTTIPETKGSIRNSNAEKIYRSMLDDEYVKSWSKGGGIGLADLIVRQLTQNQRPTTHHKIISKGNIQDKMAAYQPPKLSK